jgi:glutamate/tyrosine decarboxylase-like PLP-dependent enzyme
MKLWRKLAMDTGQEEPTLRRRKAMLDLDPEEFRRLGHLMVDQTADLLASLRERPLTPGESPTTVRQALKADGPLPDQGTAPEALLRQTTDLLFNHSMFNGHPRFWGYITSPAAPIGVLGDFLAAAVNPNVGSWILAPMATEIEAQTVRWIAELIGYPANCGGLLVSGGNMANFIGFLAARTAKAKWDVRKSGLADKSAQRLRAYTSREAHTWLMKASDLFGLGTDSIRWIQTDARQRMDTAALRKQIEEDLAQSHCPFLVVGTAGSVSTGAVDPLPELTAICREYGAWFHVDGAYGGFAAAVPGVPEDLRGLSEADSVAVDPHKWLYSPLEAGCALVRDLNALRQTFSYHPPYYHFSEEGTNYFDLGLQNSRGFRALKVWLALRQAGREGYVRMISEDIRLAQDLFHRLQDSEELEPITQGLSVTTFRFVPADLRSQRGTKQTELYLNHLNQELLTRIEKGGEVFLSNAVIGGKFALRLCIVNFRTSLEDIEALPGIVMRVGKEADRAIRPAKLRGEDE